MCYLVVDFRRVPHVLFDELSVGFLAGRLFPRLLSDFVSEGVHIVEFFTFWLLVFLHLELGLFDQRCIFSFLEDYLAAQLHQIVVSLLQNLHESRVLLSVDHVDVRVHIVVFQGFDSVALLLVLLVLRRLLRQGGLSEIRYLAHSVLHFLVEFDEIFLVVQNRLQLLLVFHLLADHRALTHLHLKSV